MTSNRQRHKMSNRLWSTVRKLGNGFAQLSNDGLGGRYSVNKFGINVDVTTQEQVKTLKQRIIEHMNSLGWSSKNEGSYIILTSPEYSGYVALSGYPESKRLHIGCH